MFALGEPAAQMGERAVKVLGKFCDTDPLSVPYARCLVCSRKRKKPFSLCVDISAYKRLYLLYKQNKQYFAVVSS